MIEVRWYYRPNEIPDGVYMPLMQDRFSENSEILTFFFVSKILSTKNNTRVLLVLNLIHFKRECKINEKFMSLE